MPAALNIPLEYDLTGWLTKSPISANSRILSSRSSISSFVKSKHRSVQIDILDPGVFHVESGSKLQKCRDTSIHVHFCLRSDSEHRWWSSESSIYRNRSSRWCRPSRLSDLKINMFQRIMPLASTWNPSVSFRRSDGLLYNLYNLLRSFTLNCHFTHRFRFLINLQNIRKMYL